MNTKQLALLSSVRTWPVGPDGVSAATYRPVTLQVYRLVKVPVRAALEAR